MDITKILDKPLSVLLTLIGAIMILGSFFAIEDLRNGEIRVNPEPAYLSLFVGMVFVVLAVWLNKYLVDSKAISYKKSVDISKGDASEPSADSTSPAGESRKLEGTWKSVYKYKDTDGVEKEYRDIIRIDRNGSHVTGENGGDPDFRYAIDGDIEHSRFLTGTWKELDKRSTNHGVFQLKITGREGRELVGKWLGIPKDDESKNFVDGTWELELKRD